MRIICDASVQLRDDESPINLQTQLSCNQRSCSLKLGATSLGYELACQDPLYVPVCIFFAFVLENIPPHRFVSTSFKFRLNDTNGHSFHRPFVVPLVLHWNKFGNHSASVPMYFKYYPPLSFWDSVASVCDAVNIPHPIIRHVAIMDETGESPLVPNDSWSHMLSLRILPSMRITAAVELIRALPKLEWVSLYIDKPERGFGDATLAIAEHEFRQALLNCRYLTHCKLHSKNLNRFAQEVSNEGKQRNTRTYTFLDAERCVTNWETRSDAVWKSFFGNPLFERNVLRIVADFVGTRPNPN